MSLPTAHDVFSQVRPHPEPCLRASGWFLHDLTERDIEREGYGVEIGLDVLIGYSSLEGTEAEICDSGAFHLVKKVLGLVDEKTLQRKAIEFVCANSGKLLCQKEIVFTRLLDAIIPNVLPTAYPYVRGKCVTILNRLSRNPEAAKRIETHVRTKNIVCIAGSTILW